MSKIQEWTWGLLARCEKKKKGEKKGGNRKGRGKETEVI